MKINDELERLLATEQYRQQTRPGSGTVGEGFEGLLAQQTLQVGQKGSRATVGAGADPESLRALADPMRLANISLATLSGVDEAALDGSDEALVESLTGGLNATLDGFDKYAANLNGSTSLKDAWSALAALESNLKGMRQDMGKLSQPDAELDSMLNEMEVMAATEKFKFSRGDYL